MTYEVKTEILGFENIKSMEFGEIDELFATIKSNQGDSISFTLVNPYLLREYSFDLPNSAKVMLEIDETSNVLVYNIMVVQNPLNESRVNFLAPIIFNKDKGLMGQIALRAVFYPHFGLAEQLKNFTVAA
ncbi:flagellar assembly protein FliW [bacterium]|nr:flagellar assembly protein FliW [bacterium]MBU1883679.1 flagellar assembly protein FliW [bacterium]